MSAPQHIFILGATGYVGGALLAPLLATYPTTTITALVRKPEAGQAVKALAPSKITIVQGSHSDFDLIEAESTKADLVINAADADDLPLIKAVIRGLAKREKKGILLETSGSALIVGQNISGSLSAQSSKVWDDTNTTEIRAIPETAPHRIVDLEVFNAHNAGILTGAVICPGLIYGVGTGPVNKKSIQIPKLVEVALRRRAVSHIGEGTNIWINIHLYDLIQLYLVVLKHTLLQHEKGVKTDAYDNFYFANSSEAPIQAITELIAPVLFKKGLVDSPHVQGVTAEEEQELAMILGHTSRGVSKRAGRIGWSAKEEGLDKAIEKDIEIILESFHK
ncbi:NAD(P)H-binding family protein [Ceratobasidium sp. AG-Ba]|nr:NAD(P)H-binding family protein [Ceratobasidium sp. AG-Ba]QRW07222.1 NAD(P)H-binding family protein [Ceratobasidium sp. AG-Ba]